MRQIMTTQKANDHPFMAFFLITTSFTVMYNSKVIIVFFLKQVYYLTMRIAGTTIGVGLGLGLAFHIRELLDQASYKSGVEDGTGNDGSNSNIRNEKKQGPLRLHSKSLKTPFQYHPNSIQRSNSSSNDSVNNDSGGHFSSSYHALMATAGYSIPKITPQRGQIIRNTNEVDTFINQFSTIIPKRESMYSFPKPIKHLDQGVENEDASGAGTGNDKEDDNNSSNSESDTNHGKGQQTFSRMWPNLPKEVQRELGTVIDFIVRDYITCWYGYVDSGVRYEDPKMIKKRLDNPEKDNENNETNPREEKEQEERKENSEDSSSSKQTAMVLSTAAIRTIPFLEILYTSLTAVLGNLSTYVGENVNISELVLVKLVHILKVNIKTYRDIRKIVLEKKRPKHKKRFSMDTAGVGTSDSTTAISNTNDMDGGGGGSGGVSGISPPFMGLMARSKFEPVSEIEMLKEYLVQGKLHQAITFGLDVPSLLFGDTKGEECTLPDDYQDVMTDLSSNETDPNGSGSNSNNPESQRRIVDELLKRRLFGNKCRLLYGTCD